MSREVFSVVRLGLGMTLQDGGRVGWRRFGVPRGGAMDDHAAEWANRLLENPVNSPVLEVLLQGGELRALEPVWIAVTGAGSGANVPLWRPVRLNADDVVRFSGNRSGVWTYVAVEDGFDVRRIMGSASEYAGGRIGEQLVQGSVLKRIEGRPFRLPAGVAGRTVSWTEVRDYGAPPALKVWRGPQWDWFGADRQELFLAAGWVVSGRSDRVGYRLEGASLAASEGELVSEPVRVGSIQVPENGEPIVTMRDGPTVGGYPKIGMVDAGDISRLAQCRPGQEVHFRLAHEG